jgi:predicted peptidase
MPCRELLGNAKIDRNTSPYTFNFNYTQSETDALHTAVELIKKQIAEEAADIKRVYITGLSMGGMGTFKAVYRYPKLFAATPECGGRDAIHYDK